MIEIGIEILLLLLCKNHIIYIKEGMFLDKSTPWPSIHPRFIHFNLSLC